MKKLSFYRLMLSVRHRLPLFLLYVIAYFIFSTALICFVTLQLFMNVDSDVRTQAFNNRSQIKELMTDLLFTHRYTYYCVIILLLLVLIWFISRRLPLTLPKALYACPADECDKLRCIKYYLLWKSVFLLILLIVISSYWFGYFFLIQPPALAVQLSLTVFTVIAFSLNPDPGNRKEALKICPDIVTEKNSTTFVSIYWSALLLLENIIFYSMLCTVSSFTWVNAAWWIPALLLNIYLAKRHITPVLKTMLNYEKLYFPLEYSGLSASGGHTDLSA